MGLVALFAACLSLWGCHGGGSSADPVVGTGGTFAGGGLYPEAVARFRKNVKRAFALVAAGVDVDKLCSGVSRVNDAQAAKVRSLAVSAAPSIISVIDTIPIAIVSQTLSYVDDAGKSHPADGLYHYPTAGNSSSEWIYINQTAWEAGNGYWIGIHELGHHAFPKLKDYVAQPPEFPGDTGGLDEMNALGYCMEAQLRNWANPADLVGDFGSGGIATFAASPSDIVMGRQSDGKIVVALSIASGAATHVVLQRLTPAGAKDTTFGTNGEVKLPVRADTLTSGGKVVHAIAMLPDDKFLVAGWENVGSLILPVLYKYEADGKPDDTFNAIVVARNNAGTLSRWYRSIAVIPDGRIVLAGTAFDGTYYYLAVWRLTPDGAVDTSLNGVGVALAAPQPLNQNYALAMALGPDGSIFVVGQSFYVAGAYNIGVVKLKADGTLDRSFNQKGTATVSFGTTGVNQPNRVAIRSDGRVLIGGTSGAGASAKLALLQLMPDGTADSRFGVAGRAFPLRDARFTQSELQGLYLQDDGRVVATGAVTDSGIKQAAVLRLLPTGDLDPDFKDHHANRGITTFGVGASNACALLIDMLPSGRLLVSGTSRPADGTPPGFFTALFLGDDAS